MTMSVNPTYNLSPVQSVCAEICGFYYFLSRCVSLTLLLRDCSESCAPTWLNVVPDNADMFVSIGSCVFVPEADHMTQLMHHNAKLVTVFPNGYGLRASSTATHIGTAPMNQQPDMETQRNSVTEGKT